MKQMRSGNDMAINAGGFMLTEQPVPWYLGGMSKIKIIKFPVGSDPFVIEIETSLEAMQAEVDGRLECVPGPYGTDVWCNEEGLILSLPFNREFNGHLIHGDFFVARCDEEGEAVSVDHEDIRRLVG
jgi:hypothetical protein